MLVKKLIESYGCTPYEHSEFERNIHNSYTNPIHKTLTEVLNMPSKESEFQAVESANLSFYQAFGALDLPRMEAIWSHENPVHCVHPGWGLLTGRQNIMDSWTRIFENTSLMHFRITDSQFEITDNRAMVICIENITSVVDANVSEFRVLTTNMFRKETNGWRIMHHHGSPLYPS